MYAMSYRHDSHSLPAQSFTNDIFCTLTNSMFPGYYAPGHARSRARRGLLGARRALTKGSDVASALRQPLARRVASVRRQLVVVPSSSQMARNATPAESSASKLKRSLWFADPSPGSGGDDNDQAGPASRPGRICATDDPENHEIARLRDVDGLTWAEIAKAINGLRLDTDKTPNLNAHAIQSRYQRIAPRIAAARGEVWRPRQFVKKTGNNEAAAEEAHQFTDEQDELLVRSYKEVSDGFWEAVRHRMIESGAPDIDTETLAKRYSML